MTESFWKSRCEIHERTLLDCEESLVVARDHVRTLAEESQGFQVERDDALKIADNFQNELIAMKVDRLNWVTRAAQAEKALEDLVAQIDHPDGEPGQPPFDDALIYARAVLRAREERE